MNRRELFWLSMYTPIPVDTSDHREPYRLEPHRYETWKRINRMVCIRCGLVRFHNPITDWSDTMGCMAKDHPDFKRVLKRLTHA